MTTIKSINKDAYAEKRLLIGQIKTIAKESIDDNHKAFE